MEVQKDSRLWRIPKLDTRQFVVLAFLMALYLAISKLTVGTNVLKISFVFIVMSLIAKWYGPIWTVFTAIVLDIVNSTIVNPSGPFFIGFTFSAIVTALIYAIGYYHQSHLSWFRIIITQGLVVLIVNIVLNTIWLFIMYSHVHTVDTFVTLLGPRFLKSAILYPIEVIIVYAFLNNNAVKQATQKIFMS